MFDNGVNYVIIKADKVLIRNNQSDNPQERGAAFECIREYHDNVDVWNPTGGINCSRCFYK